MCCQQWTTGNTSCCLIVVVYRPHHHCFAGGKTPPTVQWQDPRVTIRSWFTYFYQRSRVWDVVRRSRDSQNPSESKNKKTIQTKPVRCAVQKHRPGYRLAWLGWSGKSVSSNQSASRLCRHQRPTRLAGIKVNTLWRRCHSVFGP